MNKACEEVDIDDFDTILCYICEYRHKCDKFKERKRIDYNEQCWRTGEYNDNCECEFCDHKHECSGYENDESDE